MVRSNLKYVALSITISLSAFASTKLAQSRIIEVLDTSLISESSVNYFNWSPDIVPLPNGAIFTRFNEGIGKIDVFRTNLRGSEVGIITPKERDQIGEIIGELSISQDGSKIAFVAGGITRYYPSDIYVVNINGSGLKKLTESKEGCQRIIYRDGVPGGAGSPYCNYHYSPLISPDGSKVLFTMEKVEWKEGAEEASYSFLLCLINSDGSGFKVIDTIPSHAIPKAWSNDSRRIYYGYLDSRVPSYYGTLVEYDIETGIKRNLSELAGSMAGDLLMSPVSDKLYYHGQEGLVEFDVRLGMRRVIASVKFENLAISPDGRRLIGNVDNKLYVVDLLSPGDLIPLEIPASVPDRLGIRGLKSEAEQMAERGEPGRIEARDRLLKISSLQWIDQERVLCVIGDDQRQRIGVLTMSK
jgi:Tol biopolymer transport system component